MSALNFGGGADPLGTGDLWPGGLKPPLGYIDLASSKPAMFVRGQLGEGGVKVTGGYGSWEEVERRGRMSLLTYKGRSPYRLQFTLLFDGFADDIRVNYHVETIEKMATPQAANDEQPPALKIGGSIPHKGALYVIESLEWDESLKSILGNYIRAQFQVTLCMLPNEDQIRLRKKRKPKKPKASGKVYVWKRGDSLHKVALRYHTTQRAILTLNKIRDPKKIKPGKRLKIPK